MLTYDINMARCHLSTQNVGVIKPSSLALQNLLCSELVLSDPGMELQNLLFLSETKNPSCLETCHL